MAAARAASGPGLLELEERSPWSTIGRTSTETPANFSGGQVRAKRGSAASRSGTSMTVNPPTTSFASENGPSTTTGSPPPPLTVVAVVTGCSSAPPSAIRPAA